MSEFWMRRRNRLWVMTFYLGSMTLLASSPVTISQELKTGKRYQFRVTVDQVTSLPIDGGQQLPATNRAVTEFTLSVFPHQPLAENDGTKRVIIHHDRIAMTSKAGATSVYMDTDEPNTYRFTEYAGMDVLTKHDFTLILDDDNEVIRAEGMDAIVQEVAENPSYEAVLNEIFSDVYMKQLIGQVFLVSVPSVPVDIGGYWPVSIDLPMGNFGSMSYKGYYVYKGPQDYEGVSCLALTLTGEVDLSLTDESWQEKYIEEDSFFEGNVLFDNKLGLPRYSKMGRKMSVELGSGNVGESKRAEVKQDMYVELLSAESL